MRVLVLIGGIVLGFASAASAASGGNSGGVAEGGDAETTPQVGVGENYAATHSASRITGTVNGPDGKLASEVRVSLFPSFSPAEKQTDSEGRFTLTFNPSQFGPPGSAQPILVARDPAHNLAAALELEEDATNVSVRLGPALTFAGRITDPDGKPITNAQAQAIFQTERMASKLGPPVRADGEGRFEINGLPPGRQYSVHASAKGFSREQRDVPASDTATNRVELERFQLVRADRRIAGVVLDDDGKPVARAAIYARSYHQPNLNALTDAKGQFSLERVCPGPIQLSANARGGGYGNVTAEGGDTNITIRLGARPGVRVAGPQTASLKGKPLPDLAPLGLMPADVPAEQPLLAVLIDAEQRPSRRALRLLGEHAAALKEKGVAVVAIHTGTMADGAFAAWKQEAALPFPVGCLKGESEKARVNWGANALPWFILTDKAHRVMAEGFELDELDAKVKALGD